MEDEVELRAMACPWVATTTSARDVESATEAAWHLASMMWHALMFCAAVATSTLHSWRHKLKLSAQASLAPAPELRLLGTTASHSRRMVRERATTEAKRASGYRSAWSAFRGALRGRYVVQLTSAAHPRHCGTRLIRLSTTISRAKAWP